MAKPPAAHLPPPFRLFHCPDYWRGPAWGRTCKVCGNPPDYMVEEVVTAERINGRTRAGPDLVPYCGRHVPLEYEAQRGWAIAVARRTREYCAR